MVWFSTDGSSTSRAEDFECTNNDPDTWTKTFRCKRAKVVSNQVEQPAASAIEKCRDSGTSQEWKSMSLAEAEQTKVTLAYREAGHVVTAWLLQHVDQVFEIDAQHCVNVSHLQTSKF